MSKLLIAISQLVEHQRITIQVDDMGRYIFKLETNFDRGAKPFWVITPATMEAIQFHFEKGDIDEKLASLIDSMFQQMDEAIINNEPERY